MVEGRSGRGDRAQHTKRYRRGFITVQLPRHVLPKKLMSGVTAYYYNVPSKYRALKCPIGNEPLGSDFAEMIERADTLNGLFDEWNEQRKGLPVTRKSMPKYATVD